jgi:hypothetical protein
MTTTKYLVLSCLVGLLAGCGGGSEISTPASPAMAGPVDGAAFPVAGANPPSAQAQGMPMAVLPNAPPSQPDPFTTESSSN